MAVSAGRAQVKGQVLPEKVYGTPAGTICDPIAGGRVPQLAVVAFGAAASGTVPDVLDVRRYTEVNPVKLWVSRAFSRNATFGLLKW
jgi:hypothetical protein